MLWVDLVRPVFKEKRICGSGGQTVGEGRGVEVEGVGSVRKVRAIRVQRRQISKERYVGGRGCRNR